MLKSPIDLNLWKNVLSSYNNVLTQKAKAKTKKSASKELQSLDVW